jgi:outer membrane protein OmpA-like peptidoglycan-associated protein/tetratricopeptide (TPR) repeat protein
MNKRLLVLFIAVTFAGTVAQAQISQADKLFNSYSYSLAIPHYLKIAQKPGDPDRNYAIIRLADCYRLSNDQLNAKAWYSRAVNLPNSENINWFYYGLALQSAQEYDLAKDAFEKYNYLNPDDPRGKEYASFCTEAQKLSDIPPAFEIKNVASLNSDRSDFGPAFYGDGIIFVSDRRQNFMDNKKYEWTNSNYLDLYFSTPRYLDEFFQEMNEPKSFSGKFNQTYHDGPASFARHDSILYLTRAEKGKVKKDNDNFRTDRLKIFYSRYNGSWSKTEPFFLNSDNYSIGHPVLTPDGNTIYFVSDMPGGLGGTDIYSCQWNAGQWDLPENLGPSVNSFGNEMFPAINGNQLYFASNGFAGFGGLDIFKSTLTNGKWSKAENIGMPVNSSFDDFALVLDARGKKGFFSSNRPGGKGSDDIYACKLIDSKTNKKPCDEVPAAQKQDSLSITISGFVKDKQTLKPLPGTTVFVMNTETGKVKVLKTDANGQFKTLGSKGILYVVKGMEQNYLSDCLNFRIETKDTAHVATTPRDILLDRLEVNKVIRMGSMDYSFETIYYDFNKWFIRPEAEKELDKLVQVMKENPVIVELGSHTDSRGSKEYNMDLSQKRAESAVRYIILQGIEASRITAKGYGESLLINHCTDGMPCTAREHQANRRTEFKVTGFAKSEFSDEYDMNKFIQDEEIPVYLFDCNFFADCLQDRRIKKSTVKTDTDNVPAAYENNAQAADKTAVKEVKPVKAEKKKSTEKQAVAETKVTKPEPAITKEKAKEPAQTKQTVNTNANAVTYRVQIFALNKEKSLVDPEFEDLLDVQMYYQDGMYKYTTGVFDTHEEAQQYRSEMVRQGFSDAFVVTFTNGKRIYVSPSY